MSVLFETIKRLYDDDKLTEIGVSNAVIKGWISESERDAILHIENDSEEPTETE